jgi:hypothetical protein
LFYTDTVKFYKALSMCGTDFSMMEPLFPGRNRKVLKAMYKREEKRNPNLISLALSQQTFDPEEGLTSSEDESAPPKSQAETFITKNDSGQKPPASPEEPPAKFYGEVDDAGRRKPKTANKPMKPRRFPAQQKSPRRRSISVNWKSHVNGALLRDSFAPPNIPTTAKYHRMHSSKLPRNRISTDIYSSMSILPMPLNPKKKTQTHPPELV